jgi:transposase
MPPTKFKIPKKAKEKYPIPDVSANITLKEINGWFTATGPKNDALLTIKPTKETTTRYIINRIYPTGYQGKLLNKWLEICRVAYNHGVKYIKVNGMPNSWQTLRNEVTASSQEYFDKMIKKFGITQHIIDQSIVDAHKAYKSSFAQLLKENLELDIARLTLISRFR